MSDHDTIKTALAPLTVEEFNTVILPGILERAKGRGHFKARVSKKPIAVDKMSDDPQTDVQYYSLVVGLLREALRLTSELERDPDRRRAIVLLLTHVREKVLGACEEHKGRREGGTHYFAEYIDNKITTIDTAIQSIKSDALPLGEVIGELQNNLHEMVGVSSQ